MKEYLKAKTLLEGCSAKLSDAISHFSVAESGSADDDTVTAPPSKKPTVKARTSRRHRDVVIGDVSHFDRAPALEASPFSALSNATSFANQPVSFNSYNEDVLNAGTEPASEALMELSSDHIPEEVVLYDADMLDVVSQDQEQYFDIVDESSESEALLLATTDDEFPIAETAYATSDEAVMASDAQYQEDNVSSLSSENGEIDWGIDPSESLLIDPNDFIDTAAIAPEREQPVEKPRYRYQPVTQQFDPLDEIAVSQSDASVLNEDVAPLESPNEQQLLVGFDADEPEITIIRSSLTEKASPDYSSGDVNNVQAKPKPALFPQNKIDWDSFPIKAHHIDQAGKATISGITAMTEAVKPMPKVMARMIAQPSLRLAQMSKQAYQQRSEAAVQRLVKSVECSKSAALKTIKDSFDLNQPCSGDFDKDTLGYNQAYISEHNFKALVQLSSFSILILLCASFTFNLWIADDHGFGFRQQIVKDLSMITSETNAIDNENQSLTRQIDTFRNNEQAVESMVRYELGMIKPDETFIRIVD